MPEKFPQFNPEEHSKQRDGQEPKPEEAVRRGYDVTYAKHELGGEVENPPAQEVVKFVEQYRDRLGLKILDVGSGAGRNLVYLARQGFEATGIDISKKGVELTKQQVQQEKLKGSVVVGDIQKLPFKDASFDSAISRRVLDYNNSAGVETKMQEMARVIRSNGLLFLTVRSVHQPAKQNEVFIEENQWHGKTYTVNSGSEQGAFQHYFTEDEVRDFAKSTGFVVEELREIIARRKEKRQKAGWHIVLRKLPEQAE